MLSLPIGKPTDTKSQSNADLLPFVAVFRDGHASQCCNLKRVSFLILFGARKKACLWRVGGYTWEKRLDAGKENAVPDPVAVDPREAGRLVQSPVELRSDLA